MRFRWRRAEMLDLAHFVPWLRDYFVYNSLTKNHLIDFWRSLLVTGCGEVVAIEDLDRPRGRQLVGAGVSVFVTDPFVEDLVENPRPYPALRLLELWASGHPCVVSPMGLRHGYATGGPNLFLIHHGWPDNELSPEEIQYVRHALAQANLRVHRGYPWRCCFIEVYGATDAVLLRQLGLRVWSDYSRFFACHTPPPPERHPYLLGVRREEALAAPGTFVFSLFSTPPPCFHLTPAEQAVVRLAVGALTDQGIAQALGVAPITVKKHWAAIYQKVERSGVLVLGGQNSDQDFASRRGPEKRRLVIEYVRDHPEKIRSFPERPLRRTPKRTYRFLSSPKRSR